MSFKGTEPGLRPVDYYLVMGRYCRLWRLFRKWRFGRGPAGVSAWRLRATAITILASTILAVTIAAQLAWARAANAQDSQDLPKPSEVVKIDTLKLGGALKPGGISQLEVEAEILPG